MTAPAHLSPATAVQRVATVGVIGCGLMGSGIAETFARSGRRVVVTEVDDSAARAGIGRIEASLRKAVTDGKLDLQDAERARARISVETDLDALVDADLVVEAASEDEDVKTALFRRLDRIVVSDAAVLATNTSSVPIMKLGAGTAKPERVLGLHFFNPVPVLPLVEVVRSIMTGDEAIEEARRFAQDTLGKICIDSQDRAGFVVNALLIPYLLCAIRMYESGFASKEDIDQGMVKGCAHPMGPLALSDLIGLDTLLAVSQSLYEEFRDPGSVAPALLNRMVEAGLLGRKSGRGFYDYSS
jgi:3-hydroxybutyryl-CoA dehydrogenase